MTLFTTKTAKMKKTAFTICSFLTVCAIIIMSCEKKEDPNMKKVYYNTQPTYSTGGNPNPTGQATGGGSATTGGTSSSGTASSSSTGATCANSQTSNSVAGTSGLGANGGLGMGGTYQVNHNSNVGTVIITFATTSAPPAGAYTVVNATPGPGQCSFSDYGTFANGGTVNVSAPMTAAPNGKITYTNIVAGTYTTSGTACY